MASPQLENGHVRIANEILDALIGLKMGSYEMRVVLFVIRKTYGFNKIKDWISLSQFVDGTGIQKPHVCRALRMLVAQNIVTKGGTPQSPAYSFQKDHEKWVDLPDGLRKHSPNTVTKGGTSALPKGAPEIVTKGGNRPLPKGAHTKDNITKDRNTILAEGSDSTSSTVEKAIGEMIKIFNDATKNDLEKIKYQNKTQREAARRVIDAIGIEDGLRAAKAAVACQGEDYAPTIASPYELEKKMAKLRMHYQRKRTQKGGIAVIS